MIYAQINAAGEPVEVAPGRDQPIYRVRVADEVEAFGLMTPVGEYAILPEPLTLSAAALQYYGPEDLDRYGVSVFGDPEPPAGQRLVSWDLLLANGEITLAPTFEAVPLEELRAAKRAAAVAEYETRRQAEFAWDFGAIAAKDDLGVDQGPAGPQTLQMREGPGNDDQKNWSIAMTTALAYEGAAAGATLLPVKTTANLWVQTTASQVLDALLRGDGVQLSAVQRGMALLQRVGALKAAIDAAADAEALGAIDVTAGWPGNG